MAKLGRVVRVFALISLCALAGQTVGWAENFAASATGEVGGLSFDERLAKAFAEIERLGISGVVAVSHQSGAVIEREFGAALDDGIDPDLTQVDINSITKTVTGVMVLKLVEQGKASFETPLGDVFSNVPADKRDITIHRLLTHSAGFVESVGDDSERLSRDAFLTRAFQTPLLSSPGNQYHYSNVGYSILAAIIEVRSGKPFEAFLREDVLKGLGLETMGYAGVYQDSHSLRSNEDQTIRQASWGGHEPFWNLIGNGGLISTPREFVLFRQAVTAGRVVSPALVKASQVKHIAEDETGVSHYGYGLVVQGHPLVGRSYWHDGGNDIFSAKWMDFADKGDVLFTAAAIGSEGGADEMMSVLQRHLYGSE